jgi:hypothetical protein
MAPATDPLGSGFVDSFARPGRNITGVANMFGDRTAKSFDLETIFVGKARLYNRRFMQMCSHTWLIRLRVLNRSRGVKNRSWTSPTWFSTWPFSQPDAGVTKQAEQQANR